MRGLGGKRGSPAGRDATWSGGCQVGGEAIGEVLGQCWDWPCGRRCMEGRFQSPALQLRKQQPGVRVAILAPRHVARGHAVQLGQPAAYPHLGTARGGPRLVNGRPEESAPGASSADPARPAAPGGCRPCASPRHPAKPEQGCQPAERRSAGPWRPVGCGGCLPASTASGTYRVTSGALLPWAMP